MQWYSNIFYFDFLWYCLTSRILFFINELFFFFYIILWSLLSLSSDPYWCTNDLQSVNLSEWCRRESAQSFPLLVCIFLTINAHIYSQKSLSTLCENPSYFIVQIKGKYCMLWLRWGIYYTAVPYELFKATTVPDAQEHPGAF